MNKGQENHNLISPGETHPQFYHKATWRDLWVFALRCVTQILSFVRFIILANMPGKENCSNNAMGSFVRLLRQSSTLVLEGVQLRITKSLKWKPMHGCLKNNEFFGSVEELWIFQRPNAF